MGAGPAGTSWTSVPTSGGDNWSKYLIERAVVVVVVVVVYIFIIEI